MKLKVGRWLVAAALGFATPALASADRLVVDLAAEPSTLDPQIQWNPDSYYVYRNIFDNLVTRDDKGDIIPQIATSWRSLSNTEILFTLRGDVTFHDGSKLTAEDVAFSIKRITDASFGSPQRGQFDKIVAAVPLSTTEVKLVTDGPYPALLAQLVKLSIVPKAVVEKVGNDPFNLKPVGSGPYRFESWQRGVAVTLKRNDDYWGTKGPFPTVLFRAVPDGATRVANLQAGSSDLAVGLDNDQLAQFKMSQRVKPLTALTERLAYLRLNPNQPPFDNPKIREAVARAVDKQGIIDGILGGQEKPIAQMLTPAHFGWAEGIAGPTYDPARAKALVAEAGAAAKVPFALTTAPFFDQRVVQAIQQQLRDVGFEVTITLVDTPSFLQRTQRGPIDSPILAISRSSCACQDADGALYQLFHSGNGWTIVENNEIDGLLDRARATLDPAARLADYRKIHEIVAATLPVVPLYQTVVGYGAAKPLQFTPTPNESLFLNRMRWGE
ncbi:ABC transporter substrate-binding protein [Bosea sp. 2RAB26]|uniref:ABC transporter substrate-binding protein n=1 Tax=Bosea sp. 2RAB26 TaxID=3237476 RepID=UPI003F8FFBF8